MSCDVGEILDPKTNTCVSLKSKEGKRVFDELYKKTPLVDFFNKFILKSSTSSEPWKGTPVNELIAMMYLMQKHENDCVAIPVPSKGRALETLTFKDYSLMWIVEKGKMGVLRKPRKLIHYIKKCSNNPKTRFVLISLGLELKAAKTEGHANYLILDKKMKTVEHFEPHGGRSFIEHMYRVPILEDVLRKYFLKNFGYKYIPPREVCPYIGLQTVENAYRRRLKSVDPGGYCVAWSILYADLRLTYPDIPPLVLQDLVLETLSNTPQLLLLTIRNYTTFFRQEASQMVLRRTSDEQRKYILRRLYTIQNPEYTERRNRVKKCRADQEINPETGRCVKKCRPDQERNSATRRCVKKCRPDQERNPETGRCMKYR